MKEKISNVVSIIFTISLFVFMIMGVTIVLVQLFAVLTGNGGLAVGIRDALKLWSIRISVVAAFCGFIMSYLKPKKIAK